MGALRNPRNLSEIVISSIFEADVALLTPDCQDLAAQRILLIAIAGIDYLTSLEIGGAFCDRTSPSNCMDL